MTPGELQAFVQMVVATLYGNTKRAGFTMPKEALEDLRQDVALATWEAYQRTKLPLAGNRGYYFHTAQRQGLARMTKMRAVVHLTSYALQALHVLRHGGEVRPATRKALAGDLFTPHRERVAA